MVWTQFWDMNSGGSQKESFSQCFIEAPVEEAKVIFYNRFGHSPERISCSCCGDDYSISEYESLEQATAYHRGCDFDKDKKEHVERPSKDSWRKYVTLEDYIKNNDVCVIRADQIKAGEREGDLPQQGYVWMD